MPKEVFRRICNRIKRIPKELRCIRKGNSIILFYEDKIAKKNHVNLNWCSMNRSDGKENVGDYLAVPVFEYMKDYYSVDDTKVLSETKHVYSIGSILFFGYQDATVWGSGLLCNPKMLTYKPKLDIRLVRGPRTRKILEKHGYVCPEVYGDPAMIMPLIYKPKLTQKTKKYSVVLHKSSKIEVENQISIVRKGYEEFIDEIVASELIISTSLHGIILAEAYGVPAILLNDTRGDFNYLKYDDYYFSTGRFDYPKANSIEEALKMEPPMIPDFTKIRDNIINTFPVDLWE